MPLLDAQREGIEMYAAPRFSSFELFRPNEVALSRIIGDLLDPRGLHGQGTLFLNALLRTIGLPPVRSHGRVRVVREAPTSIGRRIDLVIETPDVLLGVENKPSAIQQPNQLAHYHEELQRTAGKRQPCLIFLSEQKPKSAEDEVVCLPFAGDGAQASLLTILKAAQPEVRASRIRDFVQDFISYLDDYFGDGSVITDSNDPYLSSVEVEFDASPEQRRAIAAIYLAHERIYERSITEIAEAITAALRGYAPDFVTLGEDASLYDELEDRHGLWGFRRPHWPQNCAVGVSSEGDLDDIYYGIWAPSVGEEICTARPLIESAAASVPNGHKSKHFPWWQNAEPKTLHLNHIAQLILEAPSGIVAEHKDIQALCGGLVALAEAIDYAIAQA